MVNSVKRSHGRVRQTDRIGRHALTPPSSRRDVESEEKYLDAQRQPSSKRLLIKRHTRPIYSSQHGPVRPCVVLRHHP